MKDRKQIIDELNREHRASTRRASGFRNVLAMLLMTIVIVVLCVITLIAKHWIDGPGEAGALVLLMIALFCFSYWALWGRKK
jgi:uncharacterized membrane protein